MTGLQDLICACYYEGKAGGFELESVRSVLECKIVTTSADVTASCQSNCMVAVRPGRMSSEN